MRYKNLTILSSVIATLALAQAPAQALDTNVGGIKANIGGITAPSISANVGNTNVSASTQSTGGGTTATASASSGGNTNATANVGLGGQSAATINASAGTGSSTIPQSLSAKANIVLGSSAHAAKATIDINGDGVIDSKDTALLKLDLNGDGVLNILDDANGDGLLTDADLNIDLNGDEDQTNASIQLNGASNSADAMIGLGGVDVGDLGNLDLDSLPLDISTLLGGAEPSSPGVPPVQNVPDQNALLPGNQDLNTPTAPPPGANAAAYASTRDISDTLRNLNDADMTKLKVKCPDVLANPNAFNASMVAICQAVASL
jgi:hypothetical protein